MYRVIFCTSATNLYDYWQREKSHGSAQIDFLVQKGDKIIPVEVKSGTQGAMQSLRWFMQRKKIDGGIRTSLENFARYDQIEVYPLYAISNLFNNKHNNQKKHRKQNPVTHLYYPAVCVLVRIPYVKMFQNMRWNRHAAYCRK
ncbi:MAG: hypothetical protein LBG28_07195 [Tannerella sp.]|jgi:hypothetical protein|nr:hypothetical protein [Tannerella sp.]